MNDTVADEGAVGEVLRLCIPCRVLAICLYSILSIVAIVGNSLIVLMILYFRRLHTPTNVLILNLAIADLLISLLCMPFSYWHVIIFDDQRWVFGALFCKLFAFLQATAVFLSSWTLVVISFDRFMAIMFVMSPWLRLTRRRAILLVLVTWTFSLVMALPLLIVNKTFPDPETNVVICQERWDQLEHLFGTTQIMQTYTSVVFALQYCMPLLVLVITYTFIGIKMWNSRVPGIAQSENSRCIMQDRHDSVKKLIPMVLLVSALYAGCWLPQNLLMNIMLTYHPSIISHPYILYMWWIAHTIAMLHSIVNPFIYYTRNQKFREGFTYFLRFLPFIEFHGFHLLNDNNRTHAVRIVNMVAYMPVTGGKKADESKSSISR
uniref:G_PROTEIN_RECEP_F1_2 domain-containing protein n=1 Tax=Steinernema glaseri TaxID=37863 RepID=A0A1I7XY14_9BILA